MLTRLLIVMLCFSVGGVAYADIDVPGLEDGVLYGDLDIVSGIGPTDAIIDLESFELTVGTSTPVALDAEYNEEEWAVVIRCDSLTVDSNVTLSFINHPSGAPVIFLVAGEVLVDSDAVIDLNGQTQAIGLTSTVPGPGGFAGGRAELLDNAMGTGTIPSVTSGFGPGGAGPGLSFATGAGGAGHRIEGYGARSEESWK